MRNRFRSGDREALAQLYDENAQVLYRYALRVTGNWAEAEDVVSATFLAAWRGRAKLRPDGDSLRPWLLGIATNIMRHDARSRRRRDIALARLPERGTVPDFADDVVGHVADTEQLRAAHAALSRLRRRDREVFMLVVWAGLEYTAAAEALGIPVGTVRSRLSRARDRLRKLTEAEVKARREAGGTRPTGAGAGGGVAGAGPGGAGARGGVAGAGPGGKAAGDFRPGSAARADAAEPSAGPLPPPQENREPAATAGKHVVGRGSAARSNQETNG